MKNCLKKSLRMLEEEPNNTMFMTPESPKIVQIEEKKSGVPSALFFPRQYIGGVENILRSKGSLVFRMAKDEKVSAYCESEVTIVSTPPEGMEKETKNIVMIFRNDNLLRSLISDRFRLSGEQHEIALREFCGENDFQNVTCFMIPQAVLGVVELSRIDLSVLFSVQTEEKIADYIPMVQIQADGKRAHIIQTGPKSEVTNAELHMLDNELYLQTSQKVRFIPREESAVSKNLILTSEPSILEKEMEDWPIEALSISLRETFERRTGIKIGASEEIYSLEDSRVTKGFYNRNAYKMDVDEGMCIWSERVRNLLEKR